MENYMNDLPSKHDVLDLTAHRGRFCVSIYSPDLSTGITVDTARITLKNVVKKIKSELKSNNRSNDEIYIFIHPLQSFIDSTEFQFALRKDLTIFISDTIFRYFVLPSDSIKYAVLMNQKFDVKQLDNFLSINQEYFVLCLGRKAVRLLRGDRYRLERVRIKSLPTNMYQALGIDEFQKSSEAHSIALGTAGKGSKAYHGQYNRNETDKIMLERYFRMIDKSIHRTLTSQNKPLVIAGVNYLLPIYKKVNSYKGIVKESILGNQEQTDLHILREKAWKIIVNNAQKN